MNRSPLFYPMSRGMDGDAGGAADLQTDVMRFMAIISMCLVAIFALVQSIPVSNTPVTPPVTEIAETIDEVPEPVPASAPAEIVLTRPEPQKIERAVPETIALERPQPKPIARREPVPVAARPDPVAESDPGAEPAPENAATSTRETQSPTSQAQKGFSLRFESDHALTRLVEQGVVGFYAISNEGTHRMSIQSDQPSFWSASTPEQFHEMDARTVPVAVVRAYQRRSGAGDVQWGVALPATMSAELESYLSAQDGGDLVIGRDGKLRMEP